MRKLRNYVIRVGNDIERQRAIKFYKRASHRPLSKFSNPYGCYVGMGDVGFGKCRSHVTCGSLTYSDERVLTIAEAGRMLTDSPARKEAWEQSFGKNFRPVEHSDLPLVAFTYDKRDDCVSTKRLVRITKLNGKYLEGYDQRDNQFKRFLCSGVSSLVFVEFRP